MNGPDSNKWRPFSRMLENNAFAYALALALCYALKSHYSTASPEQLAWVLTPTAKLAGALFRIPFEFETGTGYICRERGIIIAPACAGVNFMIMCFSVSVFPFLHRFGKPAARVVWFSGSIAMAFIFATGVNALRIFLSMHLYETEISGSLTDSGTLHRMGGIVLYLGALCLVYSALGKTADALGRFAFFQPPNDKATGEENARKIVLGTAPVVVYISLTIVVPVLNGGLSRIDSLFVEHCAAVAAACTVVFPAAFLLQYFISWRIKKR